MSSSKRTLRWSQALGLALLTTGLTATFDAKARPRSGGAPQAATNTLAGLRVVEGDDGSVTLRLAGSAAPTYNVYRLEAPDRLVVDVAAARRGKVVPRLPLDTWAAGPVTVEEVREPGGRIVRLTVALKRPSSYIVVPDGRDLVVTITPRTAPPESYFARKSAAERKAEIEAAERRAKALEARAAKLAAEAEARVREARAKAEAARRKEAEAAAAAAAARRELEQAKVGKLRLRRRLARAEAARKEAEAARRAAERSLAKIRAAAERDRAEARKLRVEAERKLAAAEASLERARAKQAEADATLARARRTVAEAEAKRREAEAALARARKAEAEALRERRRIEAEARKKGAKAVAEALARARKAEAEAKARAREAEAALEAARSEVAALRAEAEAERRAARADKAKAERLLAEAGAAMRRAKEEKAAAERARKEAEKALAEARKAAARARKKGGSREDRAALDRALAQAKAAAKRAAARERRARQNLARLRADRDRLAEMLAKERAANAKLLAAKARAEASGARREDLDKVRREMAAERARLEKLEARLSAAQRALDARLAKLEAQRTEQRKLAEAWAKERKAAGTTKIRDVRFETRAADERIVVRAEGPVEFESTMLTPTVHMLRLTGAKLPKKLERSLDTSGYGGPVRTVTAFAEGDDVKVLVATDPGVTPRVSETKGGLVWTFARPKHAKAKAKAPAAAPRSTPPVDHPEPKVGAYAAGTRTAHAAPGGRAAPASSGRASGRRGRRKWRGERIDIELQDAPIKDVLLLFSDIGRVNIIAGQGVEGTVTMKLTAVPWDQALDIILRSLGLGMVREGNVIRVATLEAIEEERRKAIEAANARVQLKPLETRLVPVSYATVDEMIPKVQSVLSPRGTVTPDSRTNTLIIMDVAENIALAEQLVAQLDSQTPQVLIEARIVEARTSFLRQLGIQWGLSFISSPGTGNPTGLLFPYSVGIGGGASGRPPDTRGLVLPGAAQNPNYAVDLPAPVGTGAGGAMGFTFGNISGNLQTNLRLSAAEDTGEVRIISAPKIVTLDNTQAQIEQGVQIPISQVSAQGVNTRYVNATLALRVTPHVTNEGAILLDVRVQKNEADFVNTGARGDPTILTKQARSRMLVNDGDTAVIGGIYTRNKSVNFKKVPWIADIPIIGWFFKNKTEADTRTEVLIFLTPKIVNRASSIGG